MISSLQKNEKMQESGTIRINFPLLLGEGQPARRTQALNATGGGEVSRRDPTFILP